MKKNNHSTAWQMVKMLTNKVKIQKTVNVVLISVLLSLLLVVLFCFSGGK